MPELERWPPATYWMKVTAGVLLVLGLARLLLEAGDVLVLVLVALILALGFQPAVEWLERRGLRRGWAVALGLLGGGLLIGLFLWLVLPDVIAQIAALIEQAPSYLREAREGSGLVSDLVQRFDLQARLEELGRTAPGSALGLIGSFGAFVLSSLTVLVLTVYFTVNMPAMRSGVARMLGREHRQEFLSILEESTRRVGGYVLGNLLISAIAGVVSFVALLIIGVPFAAALAFFVALTDLIPTVGAVIGAVVAATVAAFSGLVPFIATAAFFLVYQQVENYVIQPRVMGRTINMSAPVVILAVLIGGSLLGVLGALLAIPTAAIVTVAIRALYVEDRIEAVEEEERSLSGETLVETEPPAGPARG
jgi:predicted PurR-regulated permease PerM